MRLCELLSVPYLLEAQAVEIDKGRWSIRLSYPELPGCTAEAAMMEDALRELERRRVEMIVSLVEQGHAPPIPRDPLTTSDPLWLAEDLGLAGRVAAALARDRGT